MSDAKLLVWLDFEMTGLDAYSRASADDTADHAATDTVLEAAWMITTGELTQLTPLRSRITRLEPREPWARECTPLPDSEEWAAAWKTIKESPETDPEVAEQVAQETGLSAIVVRMHEETGLADDFRLAASGGDLYSANRLLTSGAALEQLILDDLAECYSVYTPKSIHLAGLGVSHMDQQVLGYHCPRLATTNEGGLLHYRAHDPSVARMVLGFGASTEEEYASSRAMVADELDSPAPCRMVEFDRPVRAGAEDGRPRNRVRITDLLRATTAHRAADDVVDGLAWAEWLRRKFSDALTSRAS